MGWSVQIVERPRKPAPEEVLLRRGPPSGPRKARRRWTGRSSCHRGDSRFSHVGGWWSALWPGSATSAGSAKITRGCVRGAKVRICCHDTPHAEAVGSRLRTFHTVSRIGFLGNPYPGSRKPVALEQRERVSPVSHNFLRDFCHRCLHGATHKGNPSQLLRRRVGCLRRRRGRRP